MGFEELQHFHTRVEGQLVAAVGPLMTAIAQAEEDDFVRPIQRVSSPQFHGHRAEVPPRKGRCVRIGRNSVRISRAYPLGQYSVTGGFWALPTAVQVTGAPTLTIFTAAPGQATISWTPATPGFVLQESLSLSPANWTNAPSGATNPVTVPAGLPVKFYRLSKP